MPRLSEESSALTEEAKALGLKNSSEARLMVNFLKKFFYRDITFVSITIEIM